MIFSGLGHSNLGQGKYEKAIDFYKQCLNLARDDYDHYLIWINMGLAYKGLCKYEEAISVLEKAMSIALVLQDEPGQESIQRNLGLVYKNIGKYLKATECLEKSKIPVRPNDPAPKLPAVI